MRRAIAIVALTLTACGGDSGTEPVEVLPDLAGTWSGQMSYYGLELSLTQNGRTIGGTGRSVSQGATQFPIRNGRITGSGDDVGIGMTFGDGSPSDQSTLIYTAVMAGPSTMVGTVYGFWPAPVQLTLTRGPLP